MTDLFVTREGPGVIICNTDEQGQKHEVCRLNIETSRGRNVEQALHYARLFAQAEKMKEALEDYANPRRWLRAYQASTNKLGLTRCVFTSRGHGFELAQEALAELKETNDED